MNKQELVYAIAKQSGFTQADAAKFLNATTDIISQTLKKNEEICLFNFGKFSVSKRPASKVRNPQTGVPMKVPAYKQANFHAGKGLKNLINSAKKSSKK